MIAPENHPPAEPPLGPLVMELGRLMRREFDRRLQVAKIGLTRAQWVILYQVARAEGSTQASIAETLELERMTIGRHAARLAADGWIERRADAKDKRVLRLYLRSKAQRTLTKLEPTLQQLRVDYFSGIARERRDALYDDLLKVRDNLLVLESDHPIFSHENPVS